MASGHGHATGSGGTATIAMATPTSNGKLARLPPTVFTRDRTKSDKFLKEFKQWRLLNCDHNKMKQWYSDSKNPFNVCPNFSVQYVAKQGVGISLSFG
jgi:hypothetical protein